MLKKITPKTLWSITAIIIISLSVLLILISTFGKPVADQFSFINRFNNSGTLHLVDDIYQNNSGRISQALGIGLSYRIFGDSKAQIFIPAILFILLAAVLSWFFHLIISNKSDRLTKSITLGTLTSSIILYVAPCLFDIYLWLDSDFVYLGSTIGFIFNLDVFIWMLKTPNFTKKKFFFPLIILMIFNLLYNESVMALFFGWSLIAFCATLFIKKWRSYRHAALTIFTVSTIAAIIMFTAPGTWNRMSEESGSASFLEIFFKFPLSAFTDILNTWSVWQFSLAGILGVIIGATIANKIKPKYLWLGALLSLLTITYGTLVVTFYGQKYGGIASRTMFTPNLGILLSIILSTAAVFQLVFKKESTKNITTATIIVCILCVIAAPGFIRFNRDFISVLAVRNNYISQREIIIHQYQNNPTSITLPDIPVMIKNSDASDFTVNNTRYYDWFYSNFAKYYNINPNDLNIVGGDIASDWWDIIIPSWYQVSDLQICLENNSLINQKYICSNQ